MTGKVKCTCGWSWNKSDSSKKDMYICHECGRDNSNNMKDGGWLDNYNDSEVSLPEGFVGEGIFNGPKFDNPAWGGQFQNGGTKKPITTREDFDPSVLSNVPGLTSLASGNQPGYNRQEQYGPLGDLYRYYGGQPLEHDVLVESQNKPSTSKDKNAKYISLNHDREFVNEVLDNYERVSSGKLDKGIESKLNDNSWSVSGYSSAGKDAHKTKKQGSEHHSNAIGRYTLGKGKDKKGEYISYYDKFDQGTGDDLNPGEALGLTKPFEIYDRIYLKDVNRKYQMGGNLPGAVGNMYARTGSPSKGPRRNQTDVTDASAQGGTRLNPHSYDEPDYSLRLNPFLSKDPEYNMFIGGVSPSYSNRDFSIGAHVVGVGNEDFRQLPADYGIRGSYNPSENLSVNANLSKNNVGAGMTYRFENGGEIAQNGQEMQYYQQGLDWKPKSISRDGSVIKDDRGQWDHPGEITRIKGGNITMKRDPKTGKALTKPLLGISNRGERKMMYPGQDYQFQNADYVTEYPMAKNGINKQDQKTFEQLDQLTNFTNYNKPQPGGWLNKYKS
jgi:hypothetical protein